MVVRVLGTLFGCILLADTLLDQRDKGSKTVIHVPRHGNARRQCCFLRQWVLAEWGITTTKEPEKLYIIWSRIVSVLAVVFVILGR